MVRSSKPVASWSLSLSTQGRRPWQARPATRTGQNRASAACRHQLFFDALRESLVDVLFQSVQYESVRKSNHMCPTWWMRTCLIDSKDQTASIQIIHLTLWFLPSLMFGYPTPIFFPMVTGAKSLQGSCARCGEAWLSAAGATLRNCIWAGLRWWLGRDDEDEDC